MKQLTAEWLAKAEEDYSVGAGLLRRRKIPANSICFHCQQAGEKFLKAVLQEKGVRFGKTHDLEEILALCVGEAPQFALLLDDLALLGDYAVRYRYPGIDATKAQARHAVEAAKRVRGAVLALLKRAGH